VSDFGGGDGAVIVECNGVDGARSRGYGKPVLILPPILDDKNVED
jgi:hypothetical protein